GQVVDLVGADRVDQVRQRAAVLEIAVAEPEAIVGRVRILVDALEPLGVERARSPHQAVDLVALREQELGEVRAILAGDAGDQPLLHGAALRCCSRYQATVRSMPSASGVRATKPNRSCARLTSSRRRGWPFGCVVSQMNRPVKPVARAITPASSPIEISC